MSCSGHKHVPRNVSAAAVHLRRSSYLRGWANGAAGLNSVCGWLMPECQDAYQAGWSAGVAAKKLAVLNSKAVK